MRRREETEVTPEDKREEGWALQYGLAEVSEEEAFMTRVEIGW